VRVRQVPSRAATAGRRGSIEHAAGLHGSSAARALRRVMHAAAPRWRFAHSKVGMGYGDHADRPLPLPSPNALSHSVSPARNPTFTGVSRMIKLPR
jgi:hypothetical protein